MKSLKLLAVLLVALPTLSYTAMKDTTQDKVNSPELTQCHSSKEFITTMHYLRDMKDFGLKEPSIYKIADSVSKGCSGASQRFINVTKLLTKVGIDSKSSIETAMKFSANKDDYTAAFIEIFRQTYDAKNLDLDALNSLKISLALSVEFKGSIEKAVADFKRLVEFCKSSNEMDLPLPTCAKLATTVTRLGQDFEEPISKPFIKLVRFLQESKKGPQKSKRHVLKIAKEVIAYGPMSQKNFEEGYRFAISEKGLGYTQPKAIRFAKLMAKRSYKKSVL